ncbi:MAG TPA: tRNA (cytidine(34)-2'-O)-methyltransferase [Planctomycetaceae bacterium]|nr:tRNA (cytidine(34)-2'-O)-methyltransferase [Planctomycetaceae bacterium]
MSDANDPVLNVVLYQPDIPQNTGNIGRTCVAAGAKLWLVRPLGFRLDARHLRRAGMDYWQHVDWEALESWHDVKNRLAGHSFWYFTKSASRLVWQAEFQRGDVLVFGSETRGLPAAVLAEEPTRNLRFPMRAAVRSLNLASTATAAVYEALRQIGAP